MFSLVSVVVPVYRAGGTLDALHQQLTSMFEQRGQPFEILFVEDCGGDDSWVRIQKIASRDTRVGGIKLRRNFGQHNALLCGIRAARGDVIVTIDDDLQNPPDQVPLLLQKQGEGHDVVYGSPAKETHGVFRDMASKITKLALQGAVGTANASHVSAFRAFRTSLRDAFAGFSSPTVSIDVLLSWGTSSFSFVHVRQERRQHGQSGYTVSKLAHHAFNMMTGFSILPLHLASLMGFFFSFLGLLSLAYVLVQYFVVGAAVPGFAFLASMIAIFSGAQLFTIGIIGEYLGRIHLRTMNRPAYLVETTMKNLSDDPAGSTRP